MVGVYKNVWIDHKFLMELGFGESSGNGPKISIFCSSSDLVINFPYGKVLCHSGKGIGPDASSSSITDKSLSIKIR